MTLYTLIDENSYLTDFNTEPVLSPNIHPLDPLSIIPEVNCLPNRMERHLAFEFVEEAWKVADYLNKNNLTVHYTPRLVEEKYEANYRRLCKNQIIIDGNLGIDTIIRDSRGPVKHSLFRDIMYLGFVTLAAIFYLSPNLLTQIDEYLTSKNTVIDAVYSDKKTISIEVYDPDNLETIIIENNTPSSKRLTQIPTIMVCPKQKDKVFNVKLKNLKTGNYRFNVRTLDQSKKVAITDLEVEINNSGRGAESIVYKNTTNNNCN